MTRALLAALASFAPSADAFCGFYVAGAGGSLFNNATQVALMRSGTKTVLSMQNNYQGPPQNFAMVVPVPVVLQQENVKTLDRGVFERLDLLTSPRLVEYREADPCMSLPPIGGGGLGIGGLGTYGRGGGVAGGKSAVTVEAQFAVGEYDVVILSAEDALSLDQWLKEQKYKIPSGAEPLFRPYIEKGMYFFVAKVNVKKLTFDKAGNAALSPLRFSYDSEKFELPIRLGLINAKEKQDLIVHVLADNQRYELANYPNVTIPTNIDVQPTARAEFPYFYVSLFDRTLSANPNAVVTEYAWIAGNCDPCPGNQRLTPADFRALGGDVLTGSGVDQKLRAQAAMGWRNFVITRLHARYDKTSLGEDLVLRAAPPIVGGREFLSNGTTLEQGAQPSSSNNFQARYAIRHPWTGPVACSEPVFNQWGGPPEGSKASEETLSARGAAFVKRDATKVEKPAESPIAELKIKGLKPEAGKALAVKRKK